MAPRHSTAGPWSRVEPAEGTFDVTLVDGLLGLYTVNLDVRRSQRNPVPAAESA